MAEPTSAVAAAGFAASVSSVTLALLGVEYYALVWGLVGASMAMGRASGMTWGRAVVYATLSTLVGAATGHGALAILDSRNQTVLILFSLIGGAGAQELVARAVAAVARRIDKAGG